MKLGILLPLFVLVATFESLASATKANLRQIAKQHHMTNAQQVQQFHNSNPLFAGSHYQELVKTLASNLQSKALNAGKYAGKTKKQALQAQRGAQMQPAGGARVQPGAKVQQGTKTAQQSAQGLRTFKQAQTDGNAYAGFKLKSLNGHAPAAHHGQINEMSVQKNNKLKVNPALKERLLQQDPPMTMSTKPLSKGMPSERVSQEGSGDNSPMGFGARTKSRLSMMNSMQQSAGMQNGATGASAGGSGRSARRQNLIAQRQQHMRNLNAGSRRKQMQVEEEPEQDEEEAEDPDQSIDRIKFPEAGQNKPESMKTLERKDQSQQSKDDTKVSTSKPAEQKKQDKQEKAPVEEEKLAKTVETPENPNKEHIFIPKKVWRPKQIKKANQQQQQQTGGSMTKQTNEVVEDKKPKTAVDAPVETPVEPVKASLKTEEKPVQETTIDDEKDAEPVREAANSNERVQTLRASRVMAPEPAVAESVIQEEAVQAAATADEQIIGEAQAFEAPMLGQVEEPMTLAQTEKELRLVPINLQELNGQLTHEMPAVHHDQQAHQVHQPHQIHQVHAPAEIQPAFAQPAAAVAAAAVEIQPVFQPAFQVEASQFQPQVSLDQLTGF